MPSPSDESQPRWSSSFAFYLGASGAAVGLGSIWRFPYLAGTGGGSAFILVFIVACILIATPLLIAEYALGRRSRRSPAAAAGTVAAAHGLSPHWNVIGILGSMAAFIVFSYYTVIAGWVLAYAWKSASGVLQGAGSGGVAQLWAEFLANPTEVGAWHVAFLGLVGVISARGLNRGVELANKIRAPALLALLGVLVAYSLWTGDVRRGLSFAFAPDLSRLDARVALSAIGQAFYATSVGAALMIAYGAYASARTDLVRSSLVVSGSIILVSLLATLMVFPLVFAYGMNPAQGPQLVFEVLPRAFVEMPGGRVIGSLFFLLLVLAALIPSVALLEPAVSWGVERCRRARATVVWVVLGVAWLLGVGSILSFNLWSDWRPLRFVPVFADMNFFGLVDYFASNILPPIGALLTSLLMGWRLSDVLAERELAEVKPIARWTCIWLLRYLCPLAIVAVLVGAHV